MSDTAAKAAGNPATAEVPRTPLAERRVAPGEVTVRFRQWHQMGGTAYQAGTFAGFPRAVAEDMAARGLVDLPPGERQPATQRMVRK